MKYKEILYIKQGNRETIIYTINKVFKQEVSIDKLLDDWCIDTLSTYKGRLEATKRKYNIKKQVPIYINKDLMLFPITNKKSIENIYINCLNILSIDKNINDCTVINFVNKQQLIIEKEFKFIIKYYHKAIDIYQTIK